jgi:hypothetical protein
MSKDDPTKSKTANDFADLIRGRQGTAGGLPDVSDRQAPARSESGEKVPADPPSAAGDVADFVQSLKSMSTKPGAGRGRLMFAMDATMSRQPTWDMALQTQGQMFDAVRDVGGLDVQLVFFRGFGECRHSRWVSDPAALQKLMSSVSCRGGQTQIKRVLSHALDEAGGKGVSAVVYVGDAMEENIDLLAHDAGRLGLMGIPVFLFQEGYDRVAEAGFKEIARLTKGAWCRFDAGSADQLRELLRAVAVYASGGREALKKLADTSGGRNTRLLIEQLKR